LGKLVETGPSGAVFSQPVHHYTQGLLDAIPKADVAEARNRERSLTVRGELPSAVNPPSGCRFRTRCPAAQARCAEEEPLLRDFGDGHLGACHFPLRTPVALATSGGAARSL
jgi:oligopeptide/dipeptide ABC transporter ATP-binding protein